MVAEGCQAVLFKLQWLVSMQTRLTGSLFVGSHAFVFQGTTTNAHQVRLSLQFFSGLQLQMRGQTEKVEDSM